jgi:SAM-dependent methyltransferase
MQLRWSVDGITPTSINGWAFQPDAPNWHVDILVHLGDALIGQQKADRQRADLKTAGLGDGDHSYHILLARGLTKADLPKLSIMAVTQDGVRHKLPFDPEKWIAEPAEPNSPRGVAVRPELPGNVDPRAVKRLLRLGGSYAQSAPLVPPKVKACDLLAETDFDSKAGISETLAAVDIVSDKNSILAAMRRDIWPIPDAENREHYGVGNDPVYWISGYRDYLFVSKIARAHDVRSGRCYDFGGSSGRVCRQFAIQSDDWDVWSSDFKETSIEFVAKYLPEQIKPFVNSAFPSLPIPDAYFDLIYACSVFTHINETEIPWLLELRRTLRIGGLACLSVHNDHTWKGLAEKPDSAQAKWNRKWRPDLADLARIPEGERLIVAHRDDDPYNCNVFHSDAYLHRIWGRFLRIEEITPMGHQALVVCRRIA